MRRNATAPAFRLLREPRADRRPEESEDAAAGDPARGRFAVADGASESAHAGLWARLLVEGFVRGESVAPAAWAGSLAPLQARWAAETVPRSGEALPWYLEALRDRGAFATFLGLVLEEGGTRWQA